MSVHPETPETTTRLETTRRPRSARFAVRRDLAREATRDFSAALERFVEDELADTDRFRRGIDRLETLLGRASLTRSLFSPEDVFAALAADVASCPAGEPVARHRLLARLATPAAARRAVALLDQLSVELEDQGDAADQSALLVGRLSLEQWLASGVPARENAVWQRIAALAFRDHLRSGAALLCAARRVPRPCPTEVAQELARALRDRTFAARVRESGLEADAWHLAERLDRALDRDRLARMPSVHVDGVLHLCRANVAFCEERAAAIWERGLGAADVARLADAVEDAARADAPALAELARAAVRAAQDARPAAEADRDEAVALLAAEALPLAGNPVIRAAYLRSFEVVPFCVSGEWEFLGRIWADPADTDALASYEGYLLARGEVDRARRVIRFARATRLAASCA